MWTFSVASGTSKLLALAITISSQSEPRLNMYREQERQISAKKDDLFPCTVRIHIFRNYYYYFVNIRQFFQTFCTQVGLITGLINCPLPSMQPFPDIVSLSEGQCEQVQNAISLARPKDVDPNEKGTTKLAKSRTFYTPGNQYEILE